MRANSEHITRTRRVRVKNSVFTINHPKQSTKKDELFSELLSNRCEDFYYYIDWLDLAKSSNIVILPQSNHYYYQAEDLEQTETLVNLRCLNKTKNIKTFLINIFQNLSNGCYFTGCFKDINNKVSVLSSKESASNESDEYLSNDVGYKSNSRFMNRLNNLLDSKVYIELTKGSVKAILKEAGFTVLDITNLNDKTYFCAQKRFAEE